MKVLKFVKNNFFRNLKFLSKGRQGDLNYEAVPLSPFLNPLNPSHVRRACKGAGAPHAFLVQKIYQILKFHERVIFGSKILAKLQAKPNFSSQLLRVNGILKFTKQHMQ